MILTEKVMVRVNESNYEYYAELRFMSFEPVIGEVIPVPPALLSTGSHYKITCKCDECGLEKEIMYKNNQTRLKFCFSYLVTTCSFESPFWQSSFAKFCFVSPVTFKLIFKQDLLAAGYNNITFIKLG